MKNKEANRRLRSEPQCRSAAAPRQGALREHGRRRERAGRRRRARGGLEAGAPRWNPAFQSSGTATEPAPTPWTLWQISACCEENKPALVLQTFFRCFQIILTSDHLLVLKACRSFPRFALSASSLLLAPRRAAGSARPAPSPAGPAGRWWCCPRNERRGRRKSRWRAHPFQCRSSRSDVADFGGRESKHRLQAERSGECPVLSTPRETHGRERGMLCPLKPLTRKSSERKKVPGNQDTDLH